MSKSAAAVCPCDNPQFAGRETVEDETTPFPGSSTSRYTGWETPGETAAPLPTRRTRRELLENAALMVGARLLDLDADRVAAGLPDTVVLTE